MHVELLVTANCEMASPFRENLRQALLELGLPMYRETILDSLDEGDPKMQFDSPTVLVEGEDIFGLPPQKHARKPACRVYPEGVPSVEMLIKLIRQRKLVIWEKIDDLR